MLTWGLVADIDIESDIGGWEVLALSFISYSACRSCDGKMGVPFLFQELAKYFEKIEQLAAMVKVWLGNAPFASEDAMAAPKAEFADGYLDAAIIKHCPRWDVLGLVFQMKDGAYMNSPYVEYFKVKVIRMEPVSSTQTRRQSREAMGPTPVPATSCPSS